jgi:hypothetical protein
MLTAALALGACGERAGSAGQTAEPAAARAPAEAAATATPGPAAPGPATDVRAEILSALTAHPAGLAADSAQGRAVLDRIRPADCLAADETDGMPFERICSWWSQPQARRGADISLIVDDGLILGAVVRDRPQGIEGWDCQPAKAPPGYVICMATRVASAQSEAWSGYWNSLAAR